MRRPSIHGWGTDGYGVNFGVWGPGSGVGILSLGLAPDGGEHGSEQSPGGARKRGPNHLVLFRVDPFPVMVPEVDIARTTDANIRVSDALASTPHIFPSNWEALVRRWPRNLFQGFLGFSNRSSSLHPGQPTPCTRITTRRKPLGRLRQAP